MLSAIYFSIRVDETMSAVKVNDIVGTRIGVLDVLYECDFKANDGHKMYHVKCSECGWETDSKKSDIKKAIKCTHIGSCGNYIDFRISWGNQRLKDIFYGMKKRCYNEHNKSYRWYGGKGIKICDEWLNNPKLFEEWALNNGYEDGLTIDRINEDQDYCPDNCRWIPFNDNAKYKSTTSMINVDGEVYSGKDWARKIGISENMINKYIKTYGVEKTTDFIKVFMSTPRKKLSRRQSYYDLYMGETSC